MPFNKSLALALVAVGASVVLVGCKPKAVEMPPAGSVPGESMMPVQEGTHSSTLTPEQEVDAAIKDMDASMNATGKNDFKATDFNF